jgi:hypothetical protein
MAANTRTRDSILLEALKMAEVPSLNQLDVSNGNPHTGTINATAMTIGWLQDALNLFYGRFPWAGVVTSGAVTFTANTNTIALPASFILDLRDGLLITVGSNIRRLRRRGLQNLISYSLNQNAQTPAMYCVQGTNLLVAPTPDIQYSGILWYYALPAALTGSAVPAFPSDLTLIEYVRIKAMEWIRAAPPGAALSYAERQIVELRKSGLAHNPENEDIPFDRNTFIPGSGGGGLGSWAWLGEVGT